jgi:hypothetical protein
VPVLILKSFREDLDQKGPSFLFPGEQSSRQRQAAIPAILAPSSSLHALASHREEVSWRDHSQVGILGDLLCPSACPCREISFGQGLQTPGNPPKEMLPMTRACFFLK